MGKIQEIERALKSVNDATFQDICNEVLYVTSSDFPDLNAPGSVSGKQKTKKGRPDSYISLPNGQYILIEYTTLDKNTSKAKFYEKVEKDIYDCFDKSISGISINKISKIIFCCNSKLSIQEEERFKKITESKGIKLEIKQLDTLARHLAGPCIRTAKEYLNISVDTGQIMPPQSFIYEYNTNAYATPLSNKLIGREDSISMLNSSVNNNQITIVTGKPGVGKSKLVVELLKSLQISKDYTCFCISNKHAPIHEDLRTYMAKDQPYLVFVDDANRQTNQFISLLDLLQEKRKQPIKVILTVRNYAQFDIEAECKKYKYNIINIEKLSDEEIEKILRSDDFNIVNHIYIKRIIEIADGNPRIAVMAAKLAIETQSIHSLANVADLYDKYFNTAFSDKNILNNEFQLKTLGLISFFYSINLENKKHTREICKLFNISEQDFSCAINDLHKHELIEATHDLTVVKISDQVLATYFFYKVFINNAVIPFSILLSNYFDTHYSRIADSIIPVNNAFGYDNIYAIIAHDLTQYWKIAESNHETAMKFLNLFWFYWHEETYAYVSQRTNRLKKVTNPVYEFVEGKTNNGYSQDKDDIVSLLTKYYSYPSLDFMDAIELSFEYVVKTPLVYQQLIETLRESFIVSRHDSMEKTYRQEQLVDFFLHKIESNECLYIKSFFLMLPALLRTNYRNFTSARTKHAISFYELTVRWNDVKNYRLKILEFLTANYTKYPDYINSILLNLFNGEMNVSKTVYQHYWSYLRTIIDKNFSVTNILHNHITHTLICDFKRYNLKTPGSRVIKQKHTSKEYQMFLILSYDRMRDKHDYEFNDHNEYKRLKETEIINGLECKTILQFREIYRVYKYFSNLELNNRYNLSSSLNVLLTDIAAKNPKQALKYINEIILDGNDTDFYPGRIFNSFINTENQKYHQGLYSMIVNNKFKQKTLWQWIYYRDLGREKITKKHYDDLIRLLTTTSEGLVIDFDDLNVFSSVEPDIQSVVLKVMLNRNKLSGTKPLFRFGHFFDEKHAHYFQKTPELLKAAYYQADKHEAHFDHNRKLLLKIVRQDNSYFVDFMKNSVEDFTSLRSAFQGLSIIWELDNAEIIVKGAFDYIIAKYGDLVAREDYCNELLKGLKGDQKVKAIGFLKSYMLENVHNIKVLNTVFDCLRHTFKEEHDAFLIMFLENNHNVEDFKSIKLLDSFFSGSGKTIWDDVRARQLEAILALFDQLGGKKYKYVKHKDYLKERIYRTKLSADAERKRIFQYEEW